MSWLAKHRKHAAPRIEGLLVLTETHLDNSRVLVQQIVDQQRSLGFEFADTTKCRVDVAAAHVDDDMYAYAGLRDEFPERDSTDLMQCAESRSFQASDGHHGRYFVVFDRPLVKKPAA